jgi:hypothetical protein
MGGMSRRSLNLILMVMELHFMYLMKLFPVPKILLPSGIHVLNGLDLTEEKEGEKL